MRILSLIIILLLTLTLNAQTKYSFSNRPDKFVYEFQEFMTIKVSKDTEKKVEFMMLEFTPFWNSDTLSDDEKINIIQMSNIMIKKRFNAHPSFEYYIKNIMAIKRDSVNADNFDDWLSSVLYYVKRKRKGYLHKYFMASTMFFENHYIYNKAKKVWKIDDAKIKIEIIDNNPVYHFDTINLVGTTGKDSTFIWKTTGSYYPLKERWVGHSGKVFWTRVGFAEGTVFAKLSNYKISLKSAIWTADSVLFYDRRNFSFGLLGRLSDKYSYSKQDSSSRYPSFSSYRYDLVLNDLYPDIDYQGGYALKGRQMIGSAEGKNKAFFIFKHNGQKFVWAGAKTFIIQEDKILSEKVSVNIYLQHVDSITGEHSTDSIFHPGLSLYYSNKKKNLSIYRKEEGLSKTPFTDTYHKVDLYVEELNWQIGENYIDLKSIQQSGIESRAYFESSNFFSRARYDKLKAMDRENPVEKVYAYTNQIGADDFYANDFAYDMQMGKEQTISMLLNLASKGFLLYDFEDHHVIVKPSVKVYVLANKGKTDYDVIAFNSRTNGLIPNASLNLINNNIILQGIGMVHLSDSQDVRIIPKNGRVELQKNRDFIFAGKIMAGRFTINAKDVHFEYDKFKLNMPSIDSLSFKVESFEENEYGERPLVKVKNVIEDLKGYILIDHPNNKSGRESFAEYPILISESKSYVYYDKAQIYNKVYKKDKFFYHLESFAIDSLDDFKTDGLEFKGYFASSGIFPDIQDPIKVMKDYSLGFITTTGSGGLPLYNGLGQYNDTIKLSNEGLKGSGSIKYITSVSNSNKFNFFPDSTNAILTNYVLNEVKSGIEYPPVSGKNLRMRWYPYKDLMNISTIKEDQPLAMYEDEATLIGNLLLSSKNLEGGGQINVKNAVMTSDLYKFKNRTYKSDSCLFSLKTFVDEEDEEDINELSGSGEEDEFAFSTSETFIANVDFDKRKADFESNEGQKRVDFKQNMYMCYMDKFTWYMDEEKTEFTASEDPMIAVKGKTIREIADMSLSGTQFISTHPDQDNLNFMSQRGVYSQRQKLIHAFGVPRIDVADAVIIPGDNEVKIYAKAEMDELHEAELLVNKETQYHTIYDGVFKVRGKHSYSGRGVYDYKDEDGMVQNIFFGNIEVDTAGFTLGSSEIKEDAGFTLSRYFDFAGNVSIVGANKYLTFNGGTSIDHKCDTIDNERIAFEAQIDPANIKIPIDENIQNMNGFKIFSGLKASQINGKVYSVFLSNAGNRADNMVFQSSGSLIFDKISQEYRIASDDKLAQRSLPGNYLSLSRRECSVFAEGEMDLVYNTGHVEAKAYGNGRYFKREDSSAFNVSIPLNFHFNKDALEIMANDLNDRAGFSDVDLENEIYNLMLINKLGAELGGKVQSKITLNSGGFRKVPKELLSTIFISNVQLKYNPRTRSFVSIGDIGISNLGKHQIIKYIPGKIEIKNKRSQYEITIALDLGSKEYYYFQLKGGATSGQALVFSSNKEFMTVIKEAKSEDRKLKASGKEPKFNYYLSTAVKYKKFMRMMKMKE